jgi:uncharacterized repeat protein (TIGR01451 family)
VGGEVTLGLNQYASCTVRNRIRPGTIEIEKNATPASSPAFDFTGSFGIGDFSLVDNRADENVSRIFPGLPPGTYPPVPPEPPEPPAATQLRVVKTMPRVARVGSRIPFRLTVTNTGAVAARDVKMADVPPASVASLRTSSRPRVGKGYAVWRIGRLAPGARRTIRGSVRIQAGSPGLKRNWVFAAAVNARLVQDPADTRIRARAAQAPAVTG